MTSQNKQKIKLLKILDLLRQQSDEEHPFTTYQIMDYLTENGISCDRKTVAVDIADLNDAGYEIMSCQVGKQKGYYIEDRSFSVPEIKIMMDAVQGASFITEKKTRELSDKIASLAGSNRAAVLKGSMVAFNTRKHSNESVYYNVDFLEDAIVKRKQVSFLYFDLDEKGRKVYRKEKARYTVEPMFLIYVDDNYYLMCWNSKYRGTTNYRIDRMDSMEICGEDVSKDALEMIRNTSASEYTEKVFKMYSGQSINAVLEFDRSVIGAVYDKFGEKIRIRPQDENRFRATVPVMVSPPFYGWVFQFMGKLRIVAPEGLLRNYREYIRASEEE